MHDDRSERQACAGCNRTTRAGSPLFSDRQTALAPDGQSFYLCGDCNERAISHFGRRPTEDDIRAIAARAAGLGFGSPGTIGAGGGPG